MLNYSSFTIKILHTLNIVHNELQLDEEWNDGTIHGLCMLTIVPLKSLLFSESPHWYIRELYLKKNLGLNLGGQALAEHAEGHRFNP